MGPLFETELNKGSVKIQTNSPVLVIQIHIAVFRSKIFLEIGGAVAEWPRRWCAREKSLVCFPSWTNLLEKFRKSSIAPLIPPFLFPPFGWREFLENFFPLIGQMNQIKLEETPTKVFLLLFHVLMNWTKKVEHQLFNWFFSDSCSKVIWLKGIRFFKEL